MAYFSTLECVGRGYGRFNESALSMHLAVANYEKLFRSEGLTADDLTVSYAVAIPARNEESRIVACLEACRASMHDHGPLGALVLLINNSTDRTAEFAISWAKKAALPIEIISVTFPEHLAHAGAARRLAMDRARRFLGEGGVLLTTDADSLPQKTWISANLRQLAARQVLVCGRIEFDDAEVATLLPETLESGRSETYYKSLAFELDSLLDPDPLNPWPHHGQTSGASLGMRACAYDLIGGLPVVSCGEDRALAQAFRENDLPVLYCGHAGVVTSCRTVGRAAGGMADTISIRMAKEDFVCDEQLEAADHLARRATLRSKLRIAMACESTRLLLLSDMQLPELMLQRASQIMGFGSLWSLLERESPLLQRKLISRLQMERETPRLLALVEAIKAKLNHFASGANALRAVDRPRQEFSNAAA